MGLANPATSYATEPAATADSSANLYAPSPEWLAAIRRSPGRHSVRIHLERNRYEVKHARFDSMGVWFEQDDQFSSGRWSGGEKLKPQPLTPPVPWSQIERIDASRSGIARGATLGALGLAVAILAWPPAHAGEDWAAFYALISLPVGALAGGIVAAVRPNWIRVWNSPYPAGHASR